MVTNMVSKKLILMSKMSELKLKLALYDNKFGVINIIYILQIQRGCYKQKVQGSV